jgi:hypothetical protein
MYDVKNYSQQQLYALLLLDATSLSTYKEISLSLLQSYVRRVQTNLCGCVSLTIVAVPRHRLHCTERRLRQDKIDNRHNGQRPCSSSHTPRRVQTGSNLVVISSPEHEIKAFSRGPGVENTASGSRHFLIRLERGQEKEVVLEIRSYTHVTFLYLKIDTIKCTMYYLFTMQTGSKLVQRVYSTVASKDSIRDAVRAANISVMEKMQSPELYLTDVTLAKECIPSIANRKVIVASGPPTEWSKRHEIQKGAIIGQVLFEKWADSPPAARKLLDDQTIKVESCNEHDTVGPLTGTFLFIKIILFV